MTTKKLPSVIAMIGLLVVATGCSAFQSAGPQTTQERSIQGVTAVELLTSGDLTISVGTTEALTVTAGANQLTGLTSQVIDGTLILDTKGSISGDNQISYALTVAPLDRIDISGSGDVSGSGVLRGDATLSVSGSGSARLTDLQLSGIVIDISGSGDVVLAGQADTQQVTSSGSGNYDGSGFATEETTVDVNGSGNAQVLATKRLSATTSGSGSVTYTGDPADIERSTSGSGDIVPG